VSNIIMKHQHGLVTDCHHLPMVPIVPQSAPMVSVADVLVKLYIFNSPPLFSNLFSIYFSDVINVGSMHMKNNCS